MSLFVSLLLAAAPAQVPPVDEMFASADFSIFVNQTEIPIHCDVNDEEIRVSQRMQIDLIVQMMPLRQARQNGSLSETQNQELFRAELNLATLEQIEAVHQHATYYCNNRDKLPKLERNTVLEIGT